MERIAQPEKFARIGGWFLLLLAFTCAVAGWIGPEEEWGAWAAPSVTLILGGLVALIWGYRDEFSFHL